MRNEMQGDAWQQLLDSLDGQDRLMQATFSNPRRKDQGTADKLLVRPVNIKGQLHYQFERFANRQASHVNVLASRLTDELHQAMSDYRQALIKTQDADIQVLASKKGKLSLLSHAPTAQRTEQGPRPEHNRSKTYVLPEGEPVPFLIQLGVMTPEGRVVKAKYDKFRQINRFLEMVSDVLPDLPRGRELTIVDFGCGKSYLTFALYHLLAIKEKLPVRIYGLDLKADVIEACAGLAQQLAWDKLSFAVGDIAAYEEKHEVDMVVTLHACDTATDAALLKAIGWRASVILSVPCCQHELFKQINQPELQPLLKHGLLKERFAALVTDAVRANLLEAAGYKAQLLEFIDMAHTPKNLLIRAVKNDAADQEEAWAAYERFKTFLQIDPYMGKYFDTV